MILESFMGFLSKIMFFTSYVNNATGFPKPLSAKEEQEAIIAFKNGDEKAKDRLIQHNLRLVAHIVKKYSTAGEADDFISVGCIGLIKGIRSYDPSKNVQLSTYAARCIENEILMMLRSSKKHNRVYSLDERISADDSGSDISLGDTIGTDIDEISDTVETKILTSNLLGIMKRKLSKREYEIVCMRYGMNGTKPLTQREVAKKLNISRSYISRLENRAITTMKKYLKSINFKLD